MSESAKKSPEDTKKKDAKVNKTNAKSETKNSEVSTNQPTQETAKAVSTQSSNRGLISCLVAIIVGLLLLCCLSAGGVFGMVAFFPDRVESILPDRPSNTTPPQLDQDNVADSSSDYDDKLGDLGNSNNKQETITLTEDELLAALLKNSNIPAGSGVSLKIANDTITITLPVADLFTAVMNSSENANNRSPLEQLGIGGIAMWLGNTAVNIELEVSSNGRGLALKSVTTGNTSIDQFLNDQLLSKFNFEKFLTLEKIQSTGNFVITNITLNDGEAVVSLVKN